MAGQQYGNDNTSVGGAYINFSAGEPNGGSGEMYVHTNFNTGTWNDHNSTAQLSSFVEWTGSDYRAAAGVAASVMESASTGTVVGTLAATDPDSGETYSYSIVGGSSNFEIVGNELRVKAGSALNYESTPQHSLTLRVTDSGSNTRDQVVTINVVNVNETPTETGAIGTTNLISNSSFESGTAGWTLSGSTTSFPGQGATHGTSALVFSSGNLANDGVATTSFATVVGQAYTVTFDMGAYSIASGANVAQLLNFQAQGSSVLVNEVLADAGSNPNTFGSYRYTFVADSTTTTIRFADASSTSHSIDIVLDNVQVLSVTTNSPSMTLAENSSNGTVVGQVATIDPDAYSTLAYSLTDSAAGRFAINATSGTVSVANGSLLNFDSAASHTITVRTTDQGGLTYDKVVTINLTNVNEAPGAVLDTATAVEAGGVANGAAGTNPTGNVLTNDTDPDSGDTQTVVGVVAGTLASASGSVAVAVNGNYGSITIAANGAYTYTADNSNATVQALRTSGNTLTDVFTYTMQDAGGLSSTTQITVTIQGANDTPNDITGTLTVAENSANATVVGTAAASDVDSGDGFTYSLTDSAGGRFAINSSTGQVTVATGSLLNYEANSSHSITVQVTDTAGAAFSKVMTVSVTNVNEVVGTPSDVNAAANTVTENATIGTAVGITAQAIDVDAGDTITYSLDYSAGGRYAINSSTGVVTVAGALNAENQYYETIVVRSTSSDGSSSTQAFNITVTSVNEAPNDIRILGSAIGENFESGAIGWSNTQR